MSKGGKVTRKGGHLHQVAVDELLLRQRRQLARHDLVDA